MLLFFLVFSRREVALAYTAEGAYPILGNVFKGCACSDAAIRIAYFGVVHITAYVAHILFHRITTMARPASR